MEFVFTPTVPAAADTVVVGCWQDKRLSEPAQAFDAGQGGFIARAIENSGRFTGKQGQTLDVVTPPEMSAARVLVIGLGDEDKLTELQSTKNGGAIAANLDRLGAKHAAVIVPDGPVAAHVALGARLKSYRFDLYRTRQKPESLPSLETVALVTDDHEAGAALSESLQKIADGVFLTRDLVSEPANTLYPEEFAKRASELSKVGVDIEVLGEKKMAELGMGALLGVGQGSERESQLVVMRWEGGGDGDPWLAVVGKGVCFDTGGISIKPGAGMEEMKFDMAGAGTVTGLMHALAARGAKANVVGVIGCVENMPSGNAQRPGDVVKTMSGQTIEVINTDAEGRLVLADALYYTVKTFKPKQVVDLATLTGAIIVALGSYKAGLFANDDALAEGLAAAGEATGEELWRMPLGERYDKDINSDIADMKNVGKAREAGSTAGAILLQRFVEDTPWAHLDIAGTAWTKSDEPLCPKGATAFGVRLLDRFVADRYEK